MPIFIGYLSILILQTFRTVNHKQHERFRSFNDRF
jgi:hypothetical protein